MTIELNYNNLSQLSVLFPLIVGLIYYRSLKVPYKLFAWYFIICALTEILSTFLRIKTGNNLILSHIFVPLEFFAFIFVFQSNTESKMEKKVLYPLITIMIGAILFDIYHSNVIATGVWKFNSYSRTVESLIFVCFAIKFFFNDFVKNTDISPQKNPMFWVCLGVIIYFSIDFFHFLLYNYFLSFNESLLYISKSVHAFINLICYIIFSFAFISFKDSKLSQ